VYQRACINVPSFDAIRHLHTEQPSGISTLRFLNNNLVKYAHVVNVAQRGTDATDDTAVNLTERRTPADQASAIDNSDKAGDHRLGKPGVVPVAWGRVTTMANVTIRGWATSNQLLIPSRVMGEPGVPVNRRERLGGMLSYYHREAA
jgi:hypothetical protein